MIGTGFREQSDGSIRLSRGVKLYRFKIGFKQGTMNYDHKLLTKNGVKACAWQPKK